MLSSPSTRDALVHVERLGFDAREPEVSAREALLPAPLPPADFAARYAFRQRRVVIEELARARDFGRDLAGPRLVACDRRPVSILPQEKGERLCLRDRPTFVQTDAVDDVISEAGCAQANRSDIGADADETFRVRLAHDLAVGRQ
jgi:hypothetical protein